MTIQITIPKVFKELFTWGKYRFKVFFGGRGSGKSHSIARALLIRGMEQPTRILCAREFQKSIKDSVHKLLADLIAEHGLHDFYEVQESKIIGKNGTEFLFAGLRHNVSGIKSMEGVDIVWIEEAENVSDNSYELLIPTIRKEGSEIWITFNTKSLNDPTYRRFVATVSPDIFCRKVSWRDNPYFPAVLDKERLRLQATDGEAYAHVWEGEPDTRRSGAVLAKWIGKAREDRRICKVPYDPSFEVFSAWDLGWGDSTAIWWLQWVGRELRWLDYYENNGERLDHYAQIYKNKPYNYMATSCYLPHDGGHGNIRGLSVTQQLADMGIKNEVLSREVDINPGIDLLRQTIDLSAFDADKCAEGLRALENYAYEWDETRQVFKGKPMHNWASNGADAARYAARAAQDIKAIIAAPPPPSNYVPRARSWMG